MNSLLLFIAYLIVSNPIAFTLSQSIVGGNDIANLILRTVILVLFLRLFPYKSYDTLSKNATVLKKYRMMNNILR